jgi:hypothetical protein
MFKLYLPPDNHKHLELMTYTILDVSVSLSLEKIRGTVNKSAVWRKSHFILNTIRHTQIRCVGKLTFLRQEMWYVQLALCFKGYFKAIYLLNRNATHMLGKRNNSRIKGIRLIYSHSSVSSILLATGRCEM